MDIAATERAVGVQRSAGCIRFCIVLLQQGVDRLNVLLQGHRHFQLCFLCQ